MPFKCERTFRRRQDIFPGTDASLHVPKDKWRLVSLDEGVIFGLICMCAEEHHLTGQVCVCLHFLCVYVCAFRTFLHVQHVWSSGLGSSKES